MSKKYNGVNWAKMYRYGKTILVLTLIFNIIYSLYYGWNETPINETEQLLDDICDISFGVGLVLLLAPVIVLIEYLLVGMDDDINGVL